MALIAIFDIVVYVGATKVIEPGLQAVIFRVQHGGGHSFAYFFGQFLSG